MRTPKSHLFRVRQQRVDPPYQKGRSLDTIPVGDAVSIPLTFAIAWKESKAVSLAIKSLLLHNPERGDAVSRPELPPQCG